MAHRLAIPPSRIAAGVGGELIFARRRGGVAVAATIRRDSGCSPLLQGSRKASPDKRQAFDTQLLCASASLRENLTFSLLLRVIAPSREPTFLPLPKPLRDPPKRRMARRFDEHRLA
jgi:hypothetical protein